MKYLIIPLNKHIRNGIIDKMMNQVYIQTYHQFGNQQASNKIYKQIWDCMKEHVYLEISRPLRKQVIINMMMEENERS